MQMIQAPMSTSGAIGALLEGLKAPAVPRLTMRIPRITKGVLSGAEQEAVLSTWQGFGDANPRWEQRFSVVKSSREIVAR
jgi:hypothetical protein